MRFFILFLVTTFASSLYAQQPSQFFERSNRFFQNNVKVGRIQYQELKERPELLDTLVNEIMLMNLEDKTDQFEKAFLINSYNILVIKNVIDYYPIESLMDVEGFFDEIEHLVAGNSVTLDELEFDLLFGQFPDPRLHFVLNCAAASCPTLFDQALVPSQLDSQLDFSTKMVMDRADYIKVDNRNEVILVSKIFEWYRSVFEEDNSSIRQFINYNRFTTLPEGFPIEFMKYDWTLNHRSN